MYSFIQYNVRACEHARVLYHCKMDNIVNHWMDNKVYDQFDNKIDDEIDYQNDDHRTNDDPANQMMTRVTKWFTNSQISFVTIVIVMLINAMDSQRVHCVYIPTRWPASLTLHVIKWRPIVFWSFAPHRLKCGQRWMVQDIAQLATYKVNQVHTICTIAKFRL